jgi:histone acetyltransferase (RNA polymerase elongator complex component)
MITPESASDPVLVRMRKGFTKEDVRRGAELIRESAIPSMWFFMLGAPGETEQTAEETISFVERHLSWDRCLPMFTTGIRILPGTDLAQQARECGYVPADLDLAESVFYFSPQVSEQWLLQRVNRAIAACPRVVHAAEDPSATAVGMRAHRLLHLFGVAPPYWRFYPRLLSSRFVQRARTKK